MKKCPRCKEEKPKTAFFKSTTTVDRMSTYCKACEKMYKNRKKDQYSDLYGLI